MKLTINSVLQVVIEKYNQKGEGVAFYQQMPIYVFGTIVQEVVVIQITCLKKTYAIGQVLEILKPSANRVEHQIANAHLIGGYELIHMNDQEQIRFKKERFINDFWQIAKTKITDLALFWGSTRFKYRNKITLHNGHFYQKQTHKPIVINDYLLSDIKYDLKLPGTIIYRQLDSLIFGPKGAQKWTTDTMLNHHFRIGLNSFYQVNSEVAQVVYQDIIQFVIPQGITLDLYSGIGIIAILVAQKSSQVYGVEINRSAFADAQYNSKLNQLTNVEFFCQDVKKFLQNWNGKHKIDTLILDPSRLGIEKVVIDLILQKIKPQRIIYLACNPGKQAANFKDLQVAYDLQLAKIYDMFPQTYHIESLIVLERKEQKKMVS